jgi:hypothetical protein
MTILEIFFYSGQSSIGCNSAAPMPSGGRLVCELTLDTTTTVARTVRARSVVGQLNSGHFFTTYVVDVIGAGGCGQPTAHPQNKSQQTKQTLTIPVQNWAQEFFIHFEPPVLSLSPKIGVCISVFKFWRQKFP